MVIAYRTEKIKNPPPKNIKKKKKLPELLGELVNLLAAGDLLPLSAQLVHPPQQVALVILTQFPP
jgi:hypothetical protein